MRSLKIAVSITAIATILISALWFASPQNRICTLAQIAIPLHYGLNTSVAACDDKYTEIVLDNRGIFINATIDGHLSECFVTNLEFIGFDVVCLPVDFSD